MKICIYGVSFFCRGNYEEEEEEEEEVSGQVDNWKLAEFFIFPFFWDLMMLDIRLMHIFCTLCRKTTLLHMGQLQ